jgi:hypothetical protein
VEGVAARQQVAAAVRQDVPPVTATKRSTRRVGLEEGDDLSSSTHKPPGGAYRQMSDAPSRQSSRFSAGIRTTFQCQCCFETKETKEQGLACDNIESPHMFCTKCIRRYLWSSRETGVPFEIASGESLCRIPCFSHKHGCSGTIHVKLERLWKPRELQQWQEQQNPVQQQEEEEASVGGKAMSKAMEQIQIAMKEALTKTRVRTCPNCHQAFVKNDDGCNKMTCPVCRTTSCYLCRNEIPPKGYQHFTNKLATTKGKCPLWTDDSIDQVRDQDEMRRVLFELANKVWEEYLRTDSGGH